MKPAELERMIRGMLGEQLKDQELRAKLEQLAAEHRAFNGFTWLWGPVLYQRNRILFRSFTLGHFSTFMEVKRFQWENVKWEGATGRALDQWLAEVDRHNDADLFRRLYPWRNLKASFWGSQDIGAIAADLAKRFRECSTSPERQVVLKKFDFWFPLDEPTAVALYSTDPKASQAYITTRLPRHLVWGEEKRKLWEHLQLAARSRGDEDFARKLYKIQVPLARWEADALAACSRYPKAAELLDKLEELHPETLGRDLGHTFVRLLERRGRDILPYVLRHLRQVWAGWWGRGSYDEIVKIAKRHDWVDLWIALVRTSSDAKTFNTEVRSLLQTSALPEAEVKRRLGGITGVSREWNFPGLGLAQVHQLHEATAIMMYERFPDLLRGPFKQHLQLSFWNANYTKLLGRLISQNEGELVDFVASRFATRRNWYGNKTKVIAEVEMLADCFDQLRDADPDRFAIRAANVLGQIPAYSIFQYNGLIRENRLARLLFERSAEMYLTDPSAVSNLVEGSEIHVMSLGYRALALDDPRARILAGEHLPLLLGTLLRPLHRITRRHAFGALANAANTLESARIVLTRAREAMDLPDKKYPKEQLVGLIGKLLHRWPELAGRREQRVIYRRVAA